MVFGRDKFMNLLHLRSSGGFYGAENVIIQLASRQTEAPVKSLVGCIQQPGPDNELLARCKSLGLAAQPVPCRGIFDREAIANIRNAIKTNQIDVLCTHDYKSSILGYVASIGLGIKRVSVNHLWDDIDFKLWLYQRAEGVLYNFFDHIIAVSAPVAKDVGTYLLNKRKLTVISNGIDTNTYYNFAGARTLRTTLGLTAHDMLIGVVGRLAPQKGHRDLIDAAAILAPKLPQVKYVFWGGGHLEDELRALVKHHGLEEQVIFAGTAEDMAEVYAEIDLLAMPSLSEGLPMALLEAMSAELLVLATPVGDIPEVIKDGDTGFLTPMQDSAALAQRIETLVNMPSVERERVAANARQFIIDHFSADAMAEKYRALLEEL